MWLQDHWKLLQTQERGVECCATRDPSHNAAMAMLREAPLLICCVSDSLRSSFREARMVAKCAYMWTSNISGVYVCVWMDVYSVCVRGQEM